MIAFLCALCVLCGSDRTGADAVIRDRCDLVEVNHFYDENGRHVFDQLIFYDYGELDGAPHLHIRAWRLIKSPTQWPVRDRRGGGHVSIFQDGELLRHVRAGSFRETWSQHDPELLERVHLSPQDRREFFRPRPPIPAAPKNHELHE